MKITKEEAVKLISSQIPDDAIVEFDGKLEAQDESCITTCPPKFKTTYSGNLTISYSHTEES